MAANEDSSAGLGHFAFLAHALISAFVATVAVVYAIDYEFFDPVPPTPAAAADSLIEEHYGQREIERARNRLDLPRSRENIESFSTEPTSVDDYLDVPAAHVRLIVCGHLESDAVCDPGDESALSFRLDQVVQHDRGGGIDTWDFIFVPETVSVGALRFVYRSNTGAGGILENGDGWGFVLGEQPDALAPHNVVAGIAEFGDSALASALERASDDDAESWWGSVPGGFHRFHSSLPERAGSPVPGIMPDVWTAALKVLQGFAVLGLVLGFLASLVSLTNAGEALIGRLVALPKGLGTALGLAIGLLVGALYFIAVGADAQGKAVERADASIAQVFSGRLGKSVRRAHGERIEVRGLRPIMAALPDRSLLAPARAASPTVSATMGRGEVAVSGPLVIWARAGRGKVWRVELDSTVAVRIYQGPKAVAAELDLDAVRVFPALPPPR